MKDKITLAEIPWLEEFSPLKKGSVLILDHLDDCSFSFLLKLIKCLGEFKSVSNTQGASPDSMGISASAPNERAYGVSSISCFGVVR